MIDRIFDVLPAIALFLWVYAALCAYRGTLRLPGEPAARRRGLLLNLARRAGPPALVGLAVSAIGLGFGRSGSVALALVVVGGALAYGLTAMLGEMKATTHAVTLARGLAALALSMVAIYPRLLR